MNAEKLKNLTYQNEQRDHHKTALLDHDYKKIYNVVSSDRPNANPMIKEKQSVLANNGRDYLYNGSRAELLEIARKS